MTWSSLLHLLILSTLSEPRLGESVPVSLDSDSAKLQVEGRRGIEPGPVRATAMFSPQSYGPFNQGHRAASLLVAQVAKGEDCQGEPFDLEC